MNSKIIVKDHGLKLQPCRALSISTSRRAVYSSGTPADEVPKINIIQYANELF